MVEARFVCTFKSELQKNEETGAKGQSISLGVDYEDPVFKVFTPAGGIGMTLVGSASDQFNVGKKYKVTFEEIKE